ncbi:MAG: hypothetical protein HY006_03040 [Candidatus Sungbacteria bacterium]|nr:hypothetical protein [Candidatus Sungbacteria bacterium]
MASLFIENLKEFFALVTLPTIIGAAIYFGRKLQSLEQIERTMKTMKDNIKIISNALVASATVEWDGTLLKDYSPLTLTPEGMAYLQAAGFPQIFASHEADFLDFLEDSLPTTKYDVEALATQSILLNADKEYMQPLKIYLYNHPKDSMPALAKVAGIFVRDHYLEKHPEISE